MKSSIIGTIVCGFSLALLPVWVSGCSSDPSNEPSSDAEATGTIDLALQGTSVSGKIYRLRSGVVTITGTTSASLSTDGANLDAPSITVQLLAGGYLAKLEDGWVLEVGTVDAMTGMLVFATTPAVLTSVNPLPFVVRDQLTTSLRLTFNAGNDVIQLGNGRVVVGIDVNDCSGGGMELCGDMQDNDCDGQVDEGCGGCMNPMGDCDGDGFPSSIDCNDTDPNVFPGAAEVCANGQDDNCNGQADEGCGGMACNVLQQTGCPMGQSCYALDMSTVCAPSGTVPLGGPCMFVNECAAPAFCGTLDGQSFECLGVCDPNVTTTCPGGQECVLVLPGLGVCL